MTTKHLRLVKANDSTDEPQTVIVPREEYERLVKLELLCRKQWDIALKTGNPMKTVSTAKLIGELLGYEFE